MVICVLIAFKKYLSTIDELILQCYMEQIETSGGTEAILELINMVRQDPRLWDRNSPNFITHYDVKIDRFANIASQLNLPGVNGEIVTSAWRELSEKYRRRLYDGKRRNGTTSWPFFEPMSFLRDQYEQARWHRTTPSTRSTQSPPPANVAQLVNTILNAHAAAEAEAAALAYSEPNYERTCAVQIAEEATPPEVRHQKFDVSMPCHNVMTHDAAEKNIPTEELVEKQELMNAAFRLFSAQQMKNGAKYNGDGVVASTSCTDAVIDVESTVEQDHQPQRALSSTPPIREVNSPQVTSNGGATHNVRRKTRNRFAAYSKPKHTHKQAAAVPAASGNTAFGCEMSPQYASVANANETSGDEAKTTPCHTNVADLAINNTSPVPQQPVDSAAKWENVGRVWIDMMKTIRSPQLALAAHKFVTNTLFAVLEADHQLYGTDPATTHVRIRENAPQIEITMRQ
uniref:MADF domain-containing protein n=2 Tax=Parascaris univalens TaxID=6257 RepID=A0A915BJS9_PARUN